MDQLWALKQVFDPFGRVIPGLGTIGFLPIFRCTFYRCPYRLWPFKITWGPSNSMLGAGERTCWHCRLVFWDGSNEWPKTSNTDRKTFFLPSSVAGFLGALLVVLGVYLVSVLSSRQHFNLGDAIFVAAISFPLGCWLLLRTVQAIRSIRRYNRRNRSTFA